MATRIAGNAPGRGSTLVRRRDASDVGVYFSADDQEANKGGVATHAVPGAGFAWLRRHVGRTASETSPLRLVARGGDEYASVTLSRFPTRMVRNRSPVMLGQGYLDRRNTMQYSCWIRTSRSRP